MAEFLKEFAIYSAETIKEVIFHASDEGMRAASSYATENPDSFHHTILLSIVIICLLLIFINCILPKKHRIKEYEFPDIGQARVTEEMAAGNPFMAFMKTILVIMVVVIFASVMIN